eukprot:CAMPEP_0183304218 /NCGR_PEP_ID=MMETSP0160_2-20130417/9382_1 /TAXON_ID=2839 ORGANISM="Odontella Sinensis, Strain Grunow 1884" /NCGR_SAMPLE_ID=MMETSP0160_2 /ASSEMBLY_ACC=CAM_ASM_000250 /LENGTH=379 /DNA_ID=CAMNT_0025467227 /DNA_START=131 /DNA_END=1270 /DNA_ORIENTATION=-
MDAFVQMVRNALCCVKDLNLFSGTILHDPSHTAEFYKFPEPLDQTTPLEVLIAITQFYAFVSVSQSGFHLITSSGLAKLRRVTRLAEMRPKAQKNSVVDRIVNESLALEGSAAVRSVWVGVNVLAIGIAFFWLFANSLHVTQTDWIGGLPGLIHALTVMEIALVPLLYYMIKDGSDKITKSSRMRKYSEMLKSCKGKLATAQGGADNLDAETFAWTQNNGWSPFWTESTSFAVDNSEEKMLTKEVEKLEHIVDALLADEKKSEDKSVKVLQKAAEEASEALEVAAHTQLWDGYLEYVYFVCNLIAFYGYLLGVICYYYDDDLLHGSYTGMLKLGLSNGDADWHGNFAGDFMWTVEPIIILGNPFLIGFLKPKTKKVKSE